MFDHEGPTTNELSQAIHFTRELKRRTRTVGGKHGQMELVFRRNRPDTVLHVDPPVVIPADNLLCLDQLELVHFLGLYGRLYGFQCGL